MAANLSLGTTVPHLEHPPKVLVFITDRLMLLLLGSDKKGLYKHCFFV